MKMEKQNFTKLKTPLSKEVVKKLKVGDLVKISGTIITARDMAHKYLLKKEIKKLKLNNGIIYHCGPIAKKNKKWKIIVAGPTTSIREEPYEADIIRKYNVKAIIGKGGMGDKTLKAMKKYGCVYISVVGGAAAFLASKIIKVKNVYMLKEFGIPEALWELEVKDLPGIVTMDSHGKSLHKNILKNSEKQYKKLK